MNQNDNDLGFGFVLIVLLAALGCFLITLTRQHYQTRYEQIRLYLIALGVRFAASIVIYEFGLVQVLGDEDGSGWMLGIVQWQRWVRENVGILELPSALSQAYLGHHQGYYYMLGALFYVTEAAARIPAVTLNNFFGAMTVVFVYRIAHSLFSNWTAKWSGWIACFFPSLIIWSAQTVKEPVIIFLETVALYACVNLKTSGFKIRYIGLCLVAVALLPPFRFYAAYLAGASVILALALPQINKAKSTAQSMIASTILAVPLIIGGGMYAKNEAKFEQFSSMKEVDRFRFNVAQNAGSGAYYKFDLNSSTGLFMAITVGGAHLLLAPFPWQLGGGSLRMLLTAPELLFWWWLFFAGFAPGFYYAVRNRFSEVQPLVLFIIGMGLLYSLMFGNVGLIFRQRAQLMPWMLVFAVVGLEQRAIKKILKQRERMGQPAAVPAK